MSDLQGSARAELDVSAYYREQSEPWKIEIYEDSGRLLAPSWGGFRATVDPARRVSAAGSTCQTAGAETYTHVSAPCPTCASSGSGHFIV